MENKQLFDLKRAENEVLLEFYLKTKKQLLHELQQLEAKIREINPNLASTSASQIKLPLLDKDYSTEWPLPRKIKYILSKSGHCMPARKIFEQISVLEPHMIKDKETENGYYAQVAATLSHKVKTGKEFNRHRIDEDSDYKVGLIEWFNSDGSIMNEFK